MEKPNNISDEEWADYQLKLKNGKPFTDKEWELFQKELNQASSWQKTIGVNFFSKSFVFEKKGDSTISISSDGGRYFHTPKYRHHNYMYSYPLAIISKKERRFKLTEKTKSVSIIFLIALIIILIAIIVFF